MVVWRKSLEEKDLVTLFPNLTWEISWVMSVCRAMEPARLHARHPVRPVSSPGSLCMLLLPEEEGITWGLPNSLAYFCASTSLHIPWSLYMLPFYLPDCLQNSCPVLQKVFWYLSFHSDLGVHSLCSQSSMYTPFYTKAFTLHRLF